MAEAFAEKCRRSLINFTCFTLPIYESAPHLEMIADVLESVERGEIKKLMIFAPPRNGKSEITSIRFPAWYLGRNPERRIILTSYAATLSCTFSRQVRDLIEEAKYQLLFDIKTSEESRAVNEWNLHKHRGGMIAAGVGGAITGYGADIFIIDDPVKNREEAESKVYREKTWEWYRAVVRTRLEPGAAIILMMTRWHKEDLAGKILSDQGKGWEVINLPAIAKEDDVLGRPIGEALWPKRFDKEALADLKVESGSRNWAALYEGEPQDPKSQIIQRDWIQYYDDLPKEIYRGAGIDTATSKKTSADNMSLVDVCRGRHNGYLYVDDVFCEHVSVKAFAEYSVSQHKAKHYIAMKIEENNAGEAIKQRILEESLKLQANIPITGFTSDTDKVVRVMGFQALIENGTIKFRRGHKKVEELINHLVDFPQGVIDDDVDALGFAIKAIQVDLVSARDFGSSGSRDVAATGGERETVNMDNEF